MKTKIQPNDVYGNWTIISKEVDQSNNKIKGWICKCICGNEKLIKNVATVVNGSSKSCGCLRKELLKTNNPMFKSDVRDKVSNAIKSDPNRSNIIKNASLLAQTEKVKAKRIATNIKRYGSASPASSSAVMAKVANTNIIRRGVSVPAKNQEVLDKMKQTTVDKYGVDNIMKLDEYKELISNKVKNSRRTKGVELLSDGRALVDVCIEKGRLPTSARNVRRKYGKAALEKWLNNFDGAKSSLERHMHTLLIEAGINAFIYNKVPDFLQGKTKYLPDILIEENNQNIYIDVDGLYFHSQKENNYHFKKRQVYDERGEILYQFREDEIFYKKDIVLSIIKNRIGKSNRLYARNLHIDFVTQQAADEFLLENHLMGPITAKNFGLFLDGELVTLMSYRRDGDGIDISRFCNKLNTSIVGGLSKLLNYIKQQENPRFIKSFVDRRYGNGNSLIKLGFVHEGDTLGWQWTDKRFTFNRLMCKANMDERGLSEAEYAKEFGLCKIYDAGQSKFILKLK